MKPIIRVDNLGKQYRIGQREAAYATLRESLVGAARAPFDRLRRGFRREVNGDAASDRFWALKDVSFDVTPGEVVGIIGRNGAGKSTLLRLLSRITEPTEGRADLYGRVGSLLEVGAGFHGELSGRENIYLNGAILGMKRAEIRRRFDEIVAFAQVERFINTPVKRYSSGMYMRLAFAVAAHLDTEILLIDEVLAVGDAEFQKRCLGKMGDVARDGRTVLFVSHNMNAVEEMCDKVIFLKSGRIHRAGEDVREMTSEYLFSGGTNPQSGEWINHEERPDNPWFYPLRFFIGGPAGRPLPMPIRNDEQAWVFVQGRVEEFDPGMNFGYAIFNERGQHLYWTFSTDAQERHWPAIRPGVVNTRSRLPARFLNEGNYRLELIATLHNRQWILELGVNAPSIMLSISGGLSDSPHWLAGRPGILAPVLPWHVCEVPEPSVSN